MSKTQSPFPIVIVGHVDHGKSTLIGRLLHDTGCLPEGRVEELKAVSAKRGMEIEWSFLLDALQVERDQGITVDTSRIWFRTAARPYVIIDAPGHAEFLKNMVTGAASADAAVLVTDAERGSSEQTRRHAFLLSLLGVRQVVVAINKMDLVGNREEGYQAVADDVAAYLRRVGIEPAFIVPVSARHGDNIAARSDAMPWWKGPTLLEALDAFPRPSGRADQPLRLPVQDVYRRGDKRVAVGRIESGRLRVGDKVRIAPTGQVGTVAAFESWSPSAQLSAVAGQSVAISFAEDVLLNRGQLLSQLSAAPIESKRLQVRVFWLDKQPLREGDRVTLRLATAEHPVVVERVERVVDIHDLTEADGTEVTQGGIAEMVLRSGQTVSFDAHADFAPTGRAVLVRGQRIVGGAVALGAAAERPAVPHPRNLVSVGQSVTEEERAARNGHGGGVVWLTGLSGAGKSTLAMGAQRALFDAGWQVVVLDGDNLRHGLNRDLGFTAEDRRENVRRTAEAAKLFASTGTVVLVSLISPLAEMRAEARRIGGDRFLEVWVRADLATCEARDPKGLYAKARAGEIKDFTGIDSPFEPPAAADLVIDTGAQPEAEGVDRLVQAIAARLGQETALPAANNS
ncbi:MAG TPA: adenylyl-sulfate kinase [Azospirillaceae bacterium]|nr:adenylyl-sulfate kinase [Azospirillaceae bacterium]